MAGIILNSGISLVVYLDANVFIFAILADDSKAKRAISLLEKIEDGKEKAITSSLTIDEIIWNIWLETKNRKLAIEEGMKILSIPNLEIVSVTPNDMFEALLIMQKYEDVKPRDAIHAAVSISHGVFSIVSDDRDFDGIKELKRIPLA